MDLMGKAEIKDGVVVNLILVDVNNIPDWCADWPDATGAQIGWLYVNGSFVDPATQDQQ